MREVQNDPVEKSYVGTEQVSRYICCFDPSLIKDHKILCSPVQCSAGSAVQFHCKKLSILWDIWPPGDTREGKYLDGWWTVHIGQLGQEVERVVVLTAGGLGQPAEESQEEEKGRPVMERWEQGWLERDVRSDNCDNLRVQQRYRGRVTMSDVRRNCFTLISLILRQNPDTHLIEMFLNGSTIPS